MKNLTQIFLLITVFVIQVCNAQQQIVKTDTLSGTVLTVAMDNRISDAIDKLSENCRTTNIPRTTPSTSTSRPATRVLVPNRALTTAEVCRQNPRILGYKIQIAVVKSNDEANEVKAYFRRRFPRIKVETDASLRPNYKILAGSYFSKQSAAADLAKIRQSFKSAISVQNMIFCAEAK